jgi:hypothetical protein
MRTRSLIHAARLAGLLLFFAALLIHESEGNRLPYLPWSLKYTLIVVLLLVPIGREAICLKRSTLGLESQLHAEAPRVLLAAAVCLWGGAYAVGTFVGGAPPERAVGLVFTGALHALSATLEWSSAVLALAGLVWWAALGAGRTGRNLLMAAASAGFTILVAEGVARAAVYVRPQVEGFPTYSQRLWHAKHVRLNEHGYRDGSHPLIPPPGVGRIAIVGDSYAFGHGIADPADRFGEVLTARLSGLTGMRWIPINLGRSDTHTRQHIHAATEGLSFHPQIVILLYVFNDIDYLFQVTGRTLHITEHPRTLASRLHPIRIVFWNSYLAQTLYVRGRGLLWERDAYRGMDAYGDSALLAAHFTDIAVLAARVRTSGAIPVVVPFDIEIANGGQFLARYRSFVQAANDMGIPVVSLEDALGNHTANELVVSRLDRHPNELANRLAAEAVAAVLISSRRAAALDGPSFNVPH